MSIVLRSLSNKRAGLAATRLSGQFGRFIVILTDWSELGYPRARIP